MKVTHASSGAVLGKNVKPATNFKSRLLGFMFKKTPAPLDGMYFPHCNWVHNSFVRFPLDVIFVDGDYKIVKIIRGFRPWQISGIYLKARHTFEFPAGAVPETVLPGDLLLME